MLDNRLGLLSVISEYTRMITNVTSEICLVLLVKPQKEGLCGSLIFVGQFYYSCPLSLSSVTNSRERTQYFNVTYCNFVAHSLLRAFSDPVASCNILQHISSAFYNSKWQNVVSRLRILTQQAELMLEMNQRLLWASLWMNSKSTFAWVKSILWTKLFIWRCRSRVRLFPCNSSHLHVKRFARGL